MSSKSLFWSAIKEEIGFSEHSARQVGRKYILIQKRREFLWWKVSSNVHTVFLLLYFFTLLTKFSVLRFVLWLFSGGLFQTLEVTSVPLQQLLQYKQARRAITCLQTPDISYCHQPSQDSLNLRAERHLVVGNPKYLRNYLVAIPDRTNIN